ncbi:trypsin-like peptidase domain-containing protein [Micromonospora musae]|uniref:trypsin-like peptidase domain-containing protein n=1 Tax=Micromonospora musae TaxID=1894970 RepID=UPI0034435500
MQSVGPYRFTHMLGICPVGKVWAAIDGQGRFVTVAVLDAAAANTPGWRESFAGIANSMSQMPDGLTFSYADFAAAEPWVAYPAEAGAGGEKLFQALGQECQPVPTDEDGTPSPVSGVPQPVSGAPTSGASFEPWAPHGGPQPVQPVPTPQPAVDAPHSPAPADPLPYDPFSAPVRLIEPSEPPRRRTGLWAAVAALMLVAAVGSGVAVWAIAGNDQADPGPLPNVTATAVPTADSVELGLKPWAQAAPYSPEERALAVAAPSLVFIEAVFTGYVRDAATNAPVRATPITFSRRCSAFVVTPNGHALTSSSCVKPTEETVRRIALDTVARILVREKKLDSKQVESYVQTNLAKTRFTGVDAGTEPASEIYGQLNTAKGNVTTDPAIPAQVVRALSPETGNIALIKLARENLPAVELNPSAPLADGNSLLVLGFSTSDTDFRTASYTPQSRLVSISGTGRRGSMSIYRINQDLGVTSHGGIALDPNGRVAGMIDQDQARPDRANRAVVPSSALDTLLGEAQVRNALGESDNLYRSGLEAYFAGQHSTAIAQFDAAAQNSPANLLAQAYRQNAVERQQWSRTSEGSVWPLVLLAAAGGALAAGLVVLVVLLTRRRRRVG